MKIEILRCPNCGSYTMEKKCNACKVDSITTKPSRFSLDDKYGKYRRLARKEDELGV